MRRYWGQQKPPLGVPANKGHILCPSSGLWLMSEGSGNTVADLSGNSKTGTFQNSPTWTAGNYGPAIDFVSGDNDWISVPTISVPTNITVIASIRASSYVQDGSLVGKKSANSNWLLFFEEIGAVGNLRWRGGAIENTCSVPVASYMTAGEPYIIAATQAGTAATLYINGNLVDAATLTAIGNSSDVVTIGRGDGTFYSFNGLIDFVYIYNRALSPSEIQQLYREPFCMFVDDMPVAMMYSYGAAPAPTGQVILIQMSAVPIALMGLFWLRKRAA